MRNKEEILEEFHAVPVGIEPDGSLSFQKAKMVKLILEVLIDIRDIILHQ